MTIDRFCKQININTIFFLDVSFFLVIKNQTETGKEKKGKLRVREIERKKEKGKWEGSKCNIFERKK